MEKYQTYVDEAVGLIMVNGPKLLLAIITLIVGLWIIKSLTKTSSKMMKKGDMDESLRPFLTSIISIILKILLVISVMGMVGIEMTSFIAIMGAAGLAVGMALSGTLQNFAGGVMVLVFKPYKVGDFIEAQGYMGIVKEIQIFNTILLTLDNKRVIIPNAPISSGTLVNYSAESERRVDFTFGIGYNDDIDKTREVLLSIIKANNKILQNPEPFIGVNELADSSVNLAVRVWVKGEDYWDVFFEMNETVKKEFDKQKISIPYPQTDVHLFQNKPA
ncbi:MAG: mechanosensitive ion channel domain-containing protein [Bacteroidota bacterium]